MVAEKPAKCGVCNATTVFCTCYSRPASPFVIRKTIDFSCKYFWLERIAVGDLTHCGGPVLVIISRSDMGTGMLDPISADISKNPDDLIYGEDLAGSHRKRLLIQLYKWSLQRG